MELQAIRDIPRSCSCGWDWDRPGMRWQRTRPDPACPWHDRQPAAGAA